MVADDGQIAVWVAITDFVDTDAVEGVESALVEQFSDPAVDDRGDGLLGAAHQGRHCRAVGALGQPQHHVREIAGVPGAGSGPGQFFGDHPADRAVQAADLIDQPQPASAKIDRGAASGAVADRRRFAGVCRTGSSVAER